MHSISELISLAAKEQPHSMSLKDIHEAVLRYDCAEYLVIRRLSLPRMGTDGFLQEPLDVLPTLLPCRQDGSTDLTRVCALNNSPKEVMIVIQEAIEYLQTCLSHEEDEKEEDGPDRVQRVIGIVSLCSPAISRSKLGKRSALELCSPVLENVASLVTSVSPFGTKEQGRVLITEVASLVKSLTVWASAVADFNGLQEIKSLLRELLDTTIISYASSIQASLAVRAAESYFPRFFVKSSAKEGWQEGEGAMLEVQLALENLGNFSHETHWKPSSFSDLIYLAHSTPPVVLSPSAPSDLHHLLVNALQMNMFIDEALFLLFRILTHESLSIPPEVATSLCTVLAALASTHLDPTIRQLNLRLLSLTLSKLPPPPRLEILLKLTTDEDFPQIRGPAVGLLKEAVLEALALPPDHASRNPFASSELLRVFGGVLFRPNPPGFFNERKTREELAQSLELLRIADCLSFYYVLLQRDHENKVRLATGRSLLFYLFSILRYAPKTGVRSKGNVMSVQSSVLRPLRQWLNEHTAGEEQPLMAMLSLQIGLDRIDSALRTLDPERDTQRCMADPLRA
ncbi:hypothetical protein J3R83DRAFT_10379 [Lanmaoa asiatica]|nr:hypothetical protein J3R83DRAFT_10379 [Lanmaoa asiatica]